MYLKQARSEIFEYDLVDEMTLNRIMVLRRYALYMNNVWVHNAEILYDGK